MRFTSAVSQEQSSIVAVEQLIEHVHDDISSGVDLVLFFLTADHVLAVEQVVERLWLELDPKCVIGCLAEGVIGADAEIERRPGMSLLAASLPGARLHPLHFGQQDWPQVFADPAHLARRIGHDSQTRLIIGLGDPYSTPLVQLVENLEPACPGIPLIGGMASAAHLAGRNMLIRNEQVFEEGFVGVSISGPVEVKTVVSQGARPIGQPWLITKARENVIEQLGGRPALQILSDTLLQLPMLDRQLLQKGLLIGRAISEYRDQFGRGDFLVRNLAGIDTSNGFLAVNDLIRIGQTVQFHVRDADSADMDLKEMIASIEPDWTPAGGLVCSCNSRGTRLFDLPSHDISTLRHRFPDTPFGGFFAAGEFGPVGRENFVHGHTAGIALFRPA